MSSLSPVWYITGAGTGFGEAIAKEALRRGHKVIATGRNLEAMAGLEAAGAKIQQLDVTASEDVIDNKVKEAVGYYGHITHVVNAAGYVLQGTCEEASEKEVYDSINTNLLGAVRVTHAAIPYLRAQRYGFIAMFGSLVSWIGSAGGSFYNTSKWGCSGFAESMKLELADHGIQVTCIEPGMFRTSFLNQGKRKTVAKSLDDIYGATESHGYRKWLDQADAAQLGDVSRGAAVIVDVLTKTGVSSDKDIPVRLVLGSDCQEVIRKKCRDTLALLDEWDEVIRSTDHVE